MTVVLALALWRFGWDRHLGWRRNWRFRGWHGRRGWFRCIRRRHLGRRLSRLNNLRCRRFWRRGRRFRGWRRRYQFGCARANALAVDGELVEEDLVGAAISLLAEHHCAGLDVAELNRVT